MKVYMNFEADSGIVAYDYGEGWIWLQFKNGSVYEYTKDGLGEKTIEAMKKCALLGQDLSTIMNHQQNTMASESFNGHADGTAVVNPFQRIGRLITRSFSM